ncbi:hypothetical protein EOA35_37270 [Mesorhizobium sp. M8A.F.Ca.ET.023.01.1.1]|nr:hypothetical protein EOA35_37270 [Mesorhizobium sp. M8A.F.Ca.ET.023.01.1.1]
MAQSIVGGVSAGIGNVARAVAQYSGMTAPTKALDVTRGAAGVVGNAGMRARDRIHSGMIANIRTANERTAMQDRISNNSMPR